MYILKEMFWKARRVLFLQQTAFEVRSLTYASSLSPQPYPHPSKPVMNGPSNGLMERKVERSICTCVLNLLYGRRWTVPKARLAINPASAMSREKPWLKSRRKLIPSPN